jgi:hypothetical protein
MIVEMVANQPFDAVKNRHLGRGQYVSFQAGSHLLICMCARNFVAWCSAPNSTVQVKRSYDNVVMSGVSDVVW